MGSYREKRVRGFQAGAGALLADLDTLLVYLHGHRPHTLEVRDSLIEGAGQGLFVTQPFHRGDVLCVYRGTPLTLRQFLVTYNRDYVMGGFGLNVHVDARPHPEVLARYINDNFAANSRNVAFVKLRGFPEALVVALRHIAPGEELYASYGEVYWRAKERRKGASQKPPVDVDDGATCSVDVTQNSGDVKSNQSISQ
eukprot:GGOE01046833.1.p1 GENE.GGOE01046833.1~~GGOE01046833.1.p1  ORF type:complete len:197 (+),score=39.76 GGOE01046833.1:273-863(+)